MDAKICLRWVLLLVSLSAMHTLGAEDIPCNQVRAAARIARVRLPKTVEEERAKATAGYLIDIVSAFRTFQLKPGDRVAAARLLSKMPQDDVQQAVVSALDAALCDDEPDADMEVLAGVKYGLPRLLARAVVLVPESIPAYVKYSLLAAPNAHTDYAVQMERVCRKFHGRFVEAVEALSQSDREWFLTGIFDPKRCRAIAIPESNGDGNQ